MRTRGVTRQGGGRRYRGCVRWLRMLSAEASQLVMTGTRAGRPEKTWEGEGGREAFEPREGGRSRWGGWRNRAASKLEGTQRTQRSIDKGRVHIYTRSTKDAQSLWISTPLPAPLRREKQAPECQQSRHENAEPGRKLASGRASCEAQRPASKSRSAAGGSSRRLGPTREARRRLTGRP